MSDPFFVDLCDPNLQNEKQLINTLKISFKKIFLLCNKKTKESIKELFILSHFKISDYFEIKEEFFEGNISNKNDLYESLKVDSLLKQLDEKTLK